MILHMVFLTRVWVYPNNCFILYKPKCIVNVYNSKDLLGVYISDLKNSPRTYNWISVGSEYT